MDDLFGSADYDNRKRTVTIDGDTYKLMRGTDGCWRGWPVNTWKYAERSAAKQAERDYVRGSAEWRARYHLLCEAATDPTVTSPSPAIAAVRAGMERDRERRLIAEGLAAGFNADESAVQAAD